MNGKPGEEVFMTSPKDCFGDLEMDSNPFCKKSQIRERFFSPFSAVCRSRSRGS
jgi:hypothetical protein